LLFNRIRNDTEIIFGDEVGGLEGQPDSVQVAFKGWQPTQIRFGRWHGRIAFNRSPPRVRASSPGVAMSLTGDRRKPGGDQAAIATGVASFVGSRFPVSPAAPRRQVNSLMLEIAFALGCGQWAIRTDPIVAPAADREAIQLGSVLPCQQLTYQRSKSLRFSRRQHI
jgi:hypothetical protein